jgi:hypothetical protein
MYFLYSDINECTDGTDNCGNNAQCVNEPQTFSCFCNQGFSGNGIDCQGINKASFVLASSAGNSCRCLNYAVLDTCSMKYCVQHPFGKYVTTEARFRVCDNG